MNDNKPYLFKGINQDQSEIADDIETSFRADHDVALVDASGNAVGKATKKKRRVRPPGDYMGGFCTRDEIVKHLAGAVLASSGKMYEQMSAEIADNLEHMEDIILRRVIYVLETRTLRWKVKQLWRRMFPVKLKFESDARQERILWSTEQVVGEFGHDVDHANTEGADAQNHETPGPRSAD